MKKFIVSASLALVAASAGIVGAQQTSGGAEPGSAVTAGHGSFYIGPYAGYMVFGEFDGGENGTAALSFDNKPFYGVQAGYSFSPNLSLVGNVGYSKSVFQVKYSDDVQSDFGEDVGLFFYDANLQFRLPFVANRVGSTIAPFAQVGAGAFRRTFDADDFRDAASTNVAFNAGVGMDFQIRKQIGIRLMAKDYITSFAFEEGNISIDDKIAHNFAFTAGLNFGF
jgi:hypothetical protein